MAKLLGGSALIALAASVPFPGSSARAQDMQTAAPVLDLPQDDLQVGTPIYLGGGMATIGTTGRVEYDDNIYARKFDKIDDVKLFLRPYATLDRTDDAWKLSARAEGDIRQYLQNDSENAVGGSLDTSIEWTPTPSDRLTLITGYRHIIEDRGDPEGRTTPALGPRELDSINADLSYGRRGPRWGFSVRGTATTFRYTDDIDADRNLDSYAFVGRLTYRLTPLIDGFAEGFTTKRDFRSIAPAEIDRDSDTYGGRVGFSIDPGGKIRGEAAAGIYRFDPTDSRLNGRTGLSAQVGLIYVPTPRVAFTLDAFTGNVATYRSGAQSRADTRVRLGVQQELRHNIHWQTSVIYRRSKFYGTGVAETTYAGLFQIDYTVNRRMVLSGLVRYANRESSMPLDEFSRLRVGAELRFQY